VDSHQGETTAGPRSLPVAGRVREDKAEDGEVKRILLIILLLEYHRYSWFSVKLAFCGIQGQVLQSYISSSDRTILFRVLPVTLSAGRPEGPSLRVSNDGLLRPRVARAGSPGRPPFLVSTLSLQGGGESQLRPSNEHILIVRVPGVQGLTMLPRSPTSVSTTGSLCSPRSWLSGRRLVFRVTRL
jgi:hypothetical protein